MERIWLCKSEGCSNEISEEDAMYSKTQCLECRHRIASELAKKGKKSMVEFASHFPRPWAFRRG